MSRPLRPPRVAGASRASGRAPAAWCGPRVLISVRTALLTAALLPAPSLGAQQVVDLPAPDRALQPRLEEVYRIGRMEGADWELFGERVEAAFDGAGNLYVFDPTNTRVVVVAPSGRFLRSIGSEGEGPGELRNPAGFVVLADGTVAIADMGHRAFVLYGPDGAYLRSVPLESGGVLVLGRLVADARGGAAYSVGQMMVSVEGGPGTGPPVIPTGRPIVRYPLAAGETPREVHRPWAPPPVQRNAQLGGPGGPRIAMGGPMARAFEPQLLAGALPGGGLAFSDSSAYAIKVLDAEGRLQRVLRRPIAPVEVSRRLQDAEKARRLEELESGAGPRIRIATAGPGGGAPQEVSQAQIRDMMRRQIDDLQFYPEVPVVRALATGWSGKVWVERRARDVYEDGPVDVLTATGDYLGTIEAGRMGIPSAFGPDGLTAWVERDELDVASVVVRRLPADLR